MFPTDTSRGKRAYSGLQSAGEGARGVNKTRSNGPSSEAESSRIAGNATAAPLKEIIADTEEKSNNQKGKERET